MKNVFRKISAVFMVAILLLSITSFSIFKHFCNENLVEISNYSKVDSCCKSNIVSSNYKTIKFSKKDCCKNEIDTKTNISFQHTNSIKLIKSQSVLAFSFYTIFVKKMNFTKANRLDYQDFSPPKILQNKQILFQSFLI
jgi:hypothetical protein